MNCLELNLYLCAVVGASVVGNIFWYLTWCAAKAKADALAAEVRYYQDHLNKALDKLNNGVKHDA